MRYYQNYFSFQFLQFYALILEFLELPMVSPCFLYHVYIDVDQDHNPYLHVLFYIARQLWDIKHGARAGQSAALMLAVVVNLTDDDVINLSAYIASLDP